MQLRRIPLFRGGSKIVRFVHNRKQTSHDTVLPAQFEIVVFFYLRPFSQQVRLVSVKAERPNHPSRCHPAGGSALWGGGSQPGGGSALWGVSPLGRFKLHSRSA